MTNERIVIRAKGLSDEELYFLEQDKKKIQELRGKYTRNAEDAYRDAHRNHCFRCGTPSLVEVDHRGIKIDLCVNDGCGAVHLDPGEMEKILEGGRGLFYKIKHSISSVLK
ncbi:MAG: zf-TFIIB domain-containing protein [Pseudomonadota bacterium]